MLTIDNLPTSFLMQEVVEFPQCWQTNKIDLEPNQTRYQSMEIIKNTAVCTF